MNKTELYTSLLKQAQALLEPRFGQISNTANLSALLYRALPDINWAGFYFLDGEMLRLGPFQGKPACTEIPVGRGVCGTAVREGKTLVVPNVHEFAGHIACDSASKSEIVVPLVREGKVWGVLDIDAPIFNRFDDTDAEFLQKITALL